LALVLDGDIWYVRPADDKELIGKAYEIKYNSFERVTKVSSGGSGGSLALPSYGSSTGDGSGGVQTGGVDLQGARETFQTQKSELINDIRSILDLGAESNAGPVGISSVTPLSPTPPQAPGGAESPVDLSGVPMDIYGNVRKPKVIWKSDSNTLYVVATRLQHMWVEGYLAAADRPQPLIAIEIKFFETSRDPSREFGVDWSGTFGTSGFFRQVDSVDYDPDTGLTTVETTNAPQTEGGYRTDLANLLTLTNLANSVAATSPPTSAVLSAQDVNVKLRAMLRDEETKTVSYPRMVTTNNREVVIRNVVNQPVLGSTASTSLGTGATTTAAISYLPIGTVINILPKKMQGNKVNLNMALTVSSILGTEIIQGNPYPIATSRVYSAPVEVDSGYTVAVGGLDEAREREGETGIPVLGKIPILGYAFKTKSKEKNHKNLMFFITPTLIDARDGGLPDEPQAVLRQKPPQFMPQTPRINEQQRLQGGTAGVPNAVAYLKRTSEEIGRTIAENRGTKAEYGRLDELEAALKRLDTEIGAFMNEHPDQWNSLNSYKWQVGGILDEVSKNRRTLRKKAYY
jgi:type II secretory pathway component GspD/PulD (secretin)